VVVVGGEQAPGRVPSVAVVIVVVAGETSRMMRVVVMVMVMVKEMTIHIQMILDPGFFI